MIRNGKGKVSTTFCAEYNKVVRSKSVYPFTPQMPQGSHLKFHRETAIDK